MFTIESLEGKDGIIFIQRMIQCYKSVFMKHKRFTF